MAVVAQLCILGMGIAGRQGFAGVTGVDVGLVNRYFPIGHSGFFTDSFMRDNWMPLLLHESDYIIEDDGPLPRRWGAAIEYYADPLKLVFLLTPILLVYILWQTAILATMRQKEVERELVIANLVADKAKLATEKESIGRHKAEREKQSAEEKEHQEAKRRIVERSLRLVADAYKGIYQDPSQSLLKAYEAMQLNPSARAEDALRDAYKVSILHHINRREISRITGSGPSYLAGRWKQGTDVFAETSPDGRYRIIVTERGEDGASPPGEVYLLNNETLRVVHLKPCITESIGQGRVEDVAFDTASKNVFVTRYFNLDVYSVDGRCMGGYTFSHHTKSPVHIVRGYFAGKYIIGGETKGGIWLVDLEEGYKSTKEVLSESYGDAAMSINMNSDSRLAAIVFESGRAAVLSLEGNGKPILNYIPGKEFSFGAFDRRDDNRLITGAKTGTIKLWSITATGIRETGRYEAKLPGLDWISISDSGNEMLAVGDTETLHVVDKSKNNPLIAINLADSIDWFTAKAVASPPRTISFSASLPLDDYLVSLEEVRAKAVIPFQDEMWVIADEGKDGFLPKESLLRVRGERIFKVPSTSSAIHSVKKIDDLLLLGNGELFLLLDSDIVRPLKESVSAVHSGHGETYIVASSGIYRRKGYDLIRVFHIPGNIRDIDDQLWVATHKGAYVINGNLVSRITEASLRVREIKRIGGDVWILSGDSGLEGPAFKIDPRGQYYAHPFPDRNTKVFNVFEAADITWMTTDRGIFAVHGGQLSPVSGIKSKVTEIKEASGYLWLKTISDTFFRTPGPIYRLNGLSPR